MLPDSLERGGRVDTRRPAPIKRRQEHPEEATLALAEGSDIRWSTDPQPRPPCLDPLGSDTCSNRAYGSRDTRVRRARAAGAGIRRRAEATPIRADRLDTGLRSLCATRRGTGRRARRRAAVRSATSSCRRRASCALDVVENDLARRPGPAGCGSRRAASGSLRSTSRSEPRPADPGQRPVAQVEAELGVLAADEVEHRQARLVVGQAQAAAELLQEDRGALGGPQEQDVSTVGRSTPSLKRSTVKSTLSLPASKSRAGRRAGRRRRACEVTAADRRCRAGEHSAMNSAWAMLTQNPSARIASEVGDLVAYCLQDQRAPGRRCRCRGCRAPPTS